MEPQADFSVFVLVTQYSFFMTFSGLIAATLYFHMERNNLTPRYSAVASVCMMVVAIAAINYSYMKGIVGLDGQFSSIEGFPTEFRYADWVLTTPLILAALVMLTNSQNKNSLLAKLMIADAVMIVVGYLGEVDINQAGGGTTMGWICFALSCVAFVYILITVYGELSEAAADMPDKLRSSFGALQNFVIIVWLVYPLGYLATLLGFKNELFVARELIYCIADLTAKAGFGIVAVSLAKKLSLHEIEVKERQLAQRNTGMDS